MHRPLLTCLALALAGALGGVAAILVAHPAGDPPASDLPQEVRRLKADCDDLRSLVTRLQGELEALRLSPVFRGAVPASPAPETAAGAASAPSAPLTDNQIEDRVREAVKESRAQDFERMGRGFAGFARQRETAMLDRFTEEQGLSPYQREEMDKILERRREAIGAFFRTLFGGETEVDATALREKFSDVQKETDEALKTLLSPEQYEEFRKVDTMNRRGPPFLMGGSPPDAGVPGGR